jgi:hypothetical protein
MKSLLNLALASFILLAGIEASAQTILVKKEYDKETIQNEYLLPNKRLLMLSLYKSKDNLAGNFEILDSEFNQISSSALELGEKSYREVGKLSADSSKFILVKIFTDKLEF